MAADNKENVLITGGAGFIGSHLVRHMVENYGQSIRVFNIDKIGYASCLDSLKDISHHKEYHFSRLDLCDRSAVGDFFTRHRIDKVFHLAAESHVDRSIENPLSFAQNNLLGTLHLLEALRTHWKSGKKGHRLVHVSTDEVYGSLGKSGAFTTRSPYAPRSPYASSKASADHFVRAYHHTYGLPVILVHPTNNYGPYQFCEKLIPLAISSFMDYHQCPMYGKGEEIRDWLFISDHIRGLDMAMQKGEIGESYGFGGSGEERNNRWILHRLAALMAEMNHQSLDKLQACIVSVTNRKGHDFRYRIDSTHAEKSLGYKASVGLEEGLRRTVQWYISHKDWWGMGKQKIGK